MTDFAIGVDLGGTNLRIAAIDEQGRMIEKLSLETQLAMGQERVLHDMCDAICRLRDKGRKVSKLIGIGIGVPGIIDMERGMIRESANLPGWSETRLRLDIERRLTARVILENDANCAAFGEAWLGAARHVRDMAILTLGTGVGGAIVLSGRIWHGMNGMAGEFGHTTVDPDGVLCGCGNRGCAEQYASASAVVRIAQAAIANGNAPALAKAAGDPKFSPKMIYELAQNGAEDARSVFQQLGRALGILIANQVNSLNLPMYVVGGGVANAWDLFAPALFAELRQRSVVYAATAPAIENNVGEDFGKLATTRNTVITRALLGSDAGLYGAARLPMVEKQ